MTFARRTPPLPLATLLLAALAVAACSATKKLQLGATCSLNSDCNEPLSCKFGKCHRTCNQSRDCDHGELCVQVEGGAVCQLPDEKACGAGCPSPLVCGPDNQCRNTCANGAACLSGQTCGAGAVCTDSGDTVDGGTGAAGTGGTGGSAGGTTGSAGAGGAAGAGGDGADAAAGRDAGSGTCQGAFDTAEQACGLVLQTVVQGRLTATDKTDYYTVPVQAGVFYDVELTNSTAVGSNVNVSVDLVADGQTTPLLGGTGVAMGSTLYREIAPLSSGVAVVKVWRGDLDPPATYDLIVVPSAGTVRDAKTFEPNNSRHTAAPLALDTAVETVLTLPQDHDDFFTVAVEKGHSYSLDFRVASAASPVNLTVTLFVGAAATGEPVLTDGLNHDEMHYLELKAADSGLLVLDFSSAGSASYSFTLHKSTADGLVHDALFEPNNTASTAAPLTLGLESAALINPVDDFVDWYQATVEANATYVLTLTSPGAATAGSFNVRATLTPGSAPFTPDRVSGNEMKTYTIMPIVPGTLAIAIDGPTSSLAYKIKLVKQ